MKEAKKLKAIPFSESDFNELNEFTLNHPVSGNELVRTATMERIRGNHIDLPEDAIEKALGSGSMAILRTVLIKEFVKKVNKNKATTSQQI